MTLPPVEIITYNIFNTEFSQLMCLEDAIAKGYTPDEGRNKVEHISIASYPSLLFPALKSIKRDYNFFSTSHIERAALLYAISCLQEHPVITNILEVNSRIAHESTDVEVLRGLDVVAKLDYCTPSRCDSTSISVLSWCREWIHANCWALGLSKSQLCLYSLIFALSRYTFMNPVITQEIRSETEHFFQYINNKNEIMEAL